MKTIVIVAAILAASPALADGVCRHTVTNKIEIWDCFTDHHTEITIGRDMNKPHVAIAVSDGKGYRMEPFEVVEGKPLK